MSGIEQDQEKLLNASAQTAQNILSTAVNLSSLHKTKTKVQIQTAKNDIEDTQKLLNNGTKLENIKNSLANSSIGKGIIKAGGNLENYVNLIVKKAKINNALAQNDIPAKSNKISKKL